MAIPPGRDAAPPDSQLLAILGTDPLAFEAFYRRHVDRITGFAVRRRSHPDEVADLVAEVSLAAIRSAERYDPTRDEPVSWLFGIASNQLRIQRRRPWRQLQLVTVSRASGCSPPTSRALGERIDAERLWEDVRRAVGRLPRDECRAFRRGSGPGDGEAEGHGGSGEPT